MVKAAVRRQASSQTVLKLWEAISSVRYSRQIPNIPRITNYMLKHEQLAVEDTSLQVQYAVDDGLLTERVSVGCKGSKAGVEQTSYRIPEDDIEKDTHDWYCFECHKGGEVIECGTCFRVYHPTCVRNLDVSNSSHLMIFSCLVCKKVKNKTHIKQVLLNKLLGYVTQRLKEKSKDLHKICIKEEDAWRYKMLVYMPVDLNTMEVKGKKRRYQTLEEYRADACILLHNVIIFFGPYSKMAALATQMLSDCNYDLSEIEICKDCYHMSNAKPGNWFSRPCDPPHELVFAKQKGFPYWPAKVVRHVDNTYDVRFFGGHHQRAKLDEENIMPIKSQLRDQNIKNTPGFKKALNELHYLEKLTAFAVKKEYDDEDDDEHNDEHDEVDEKKELSSPRLSVNKDFTVVKSSSKARSSAKKPAEELVPTVKSTRKKRKPRWRYSDDEDEEYSPKKSVSSSKSKKAKINIETKEKQLTPEPKKGSTVKDSAKKKSVASGSDTYQSPKLPKAPKSGGRKRKWKLEESSDMVSSTIEYGDDVGNSSTISHDRAKVNATSAGNCCEQSCKDLQKRLTSEFEAEKTKALLAQKETLLKKFENEKQDALDMEIASIKEAHTNEIKQLTQKHQEAISDVKRRQWCSNCEQEAMYHCCWNTSYCSIQCQQEHWKEHKRTCRRKQSSSK